MCIGRIIDIIADLFDRILGEDFLEMESDEYELYLRELAKRGMLHEPVETDNESN